MGWRQKPAYFRSKIGNPSPAVCLIGYNLTNPTYFTKITEKEHDRWVGETSNSNTPKYR